MKLVLVNCSTNRGIVVPLAMLGRCPGYVSICSVLYFSTKLFSPTRLPIKKIFQTLGTK